MVHVSVSMLGKEEKNEIKNNMQQTYGKHVLQPEKLPTFKTVYYYSKMSQH